jgi:hypothetical protein
MDELASSLPAIFNGIEVSSFKDRVEEIKPDYSCEQLLAMRQGT